MTVLTTDAASTLVNTESGLREFDPEITELAGGGFVVAWEAEIDFDTYSSNLLFFRLYGSDGTAMGDPQAIVPDETAGQENVRIAALPDGGFVAVWESFFTDGDAYGISGRIFDAGGNAVTEEFVVNQTTAASQFSPAVTVLDDGSFVVGWESGSEAYMRHFGSDGMPASDEMLMSTTDGYVSGGPTLAALEDGGYVVAWYDWLDGIFRDVDNYVYFQEYTADDTPVGDPVQVSLGYWDGTESYVSLDDPSIAALAGGGFVISGAFRDEYVLNNLDYLDEGYFAVAYDASGTQTGSEVVLYEDEGDFDDQALSYPDLLALSGGDFLMTLTQRQRFNNIYEDGTVVALPFTGGGMPDGSASVLSDAGAPYDYSRLADVAELSDGSVAVVWESGNDDFTESDILLRLFALEADPPEGMLFTDSAGAQDFVGDAGEDTVSYADSGDRVLADLLVDAAALGGARFYVSGSPEGDSYGSIENLIGSANADNLRGDDGDNLLTGGGASDRLYGRKGDDTLLGEAGADAIYGNLGADVMTGGEGEGVRDRFIYFHTDDSFAGTGLRDIITDFTAGEDRIELSRLDADTTTAGRQGFTWVGDTAFSGTAGELGYRQEGGATIVQADLDGDGAADFEIELTGTMELTVDDFLL